MKRDEISEAVMNDLKGRMDPILAFMEENNISGGFVFDTYGHMYTGQGGNIATTVGMFEAFTFALKLESSRNYLHGNE